MWNKIEKKANWKWLCEAKMKNKSKWIIIWLSRSGGWFDYALDSIKLHDILINMPFNREKNME